MEMSGPHVTSIRYFVIALLLSGGLIHLAPSVARAQGPDTGSSTDLDRGVELYERGDASGAIDALRKAVKQNSEDGMAWHYLGLAFQLRQDNGEARKAFERAANIRVRELASVSSI